MKKGTSCRFDFPKLPADETIVSTPVDKDTEQGKFDLKKSKEIKDKVKAYLQSEQFDEKKELSEILRDLDIPPEEYKKSPKNL